MLATLKRGKVWPRVIALAIVLGLCIGLVHSHTIQIGDAHAATITHSSHGDSDHGKTAPGHSLAGPSCMFCILFGGKLYFTSYSSTFAIPLSDGHDFTLLSQSYSSIAGQSLFRPPIAHI